MQKQPEPKLRPMSGDARQELRRLQAAGASYTVVDVRGREEYARGHLPGAVSLPEAEVMRLAPRLLPHREEPVFVYCDKGGRSRVAAQLLAALGYRRVWDLGAQRGL